MASTKQNPVSESTAEVVSKAVPDRFPMSIDEFIYGSSESKTLLAGFRALMWDDLAPKLVKDWQARLDEYKNKEIK